ncbi:MAG: HAD family hydrolase [bacterium]|nr:HAD family hydrolase [Gammaproteobacteria bacterium]HIL96144.1 HAD family hydrolase [Pseudomonadales bacterium]
MQDSLQSRRIAMWSPPRARSTMVMRVFEALGCAVFDEPFYPYWLKVLNKIDDPGFAETMSVHETDWHKVIDLVRGPFPKAAEFYYQKHMAIHMLPEVDLSWMSDVRNCFLIRNPTEVITSMAKFRNLEQDVEEGARLVGIPQLERIYEHACDIEGGQPLVIDANDLLMDPKRILGRFCEAVGMQFDSACDIKWKAGKHQYDGAWADAWYQKVYQTTSLGSYMPQEVEVPPGLAAVVERCMPTYERIAKYRIQ